MNVHWWMAATVIALASCASPAPPAPSELPDLSRQLVIAFHTEPALVVHPRLENCRLTSHDGTPVPNVKLAEGSAAFVVDDLQPGSYDIEIADPLYLPWKRSGVSPGSVVHADLVANGAIDLHVIDERTRQPVDAYSVSVVYEQVRIWPNEWELRNAQRVGPGHASLGGLLPGKFRLRIRHPEFATNELAIDDLKPGETRGATAALSRGGTLAGRVYAGSRPMPEANVRVMLVPRGMEDWIAITDAKTSTSAPNSFHPEWTITDADGRFRFEHVPLETTWTVRAVIDPWLVAEAALTADSEAELRENVRLILPAHQQVRLQLTGLEKLSFRPTILFARPSGRELVVDPWMSERGLDFKVDASGRVDLGALPLGKIALELWADWNSGPSLALGTIELGGQDRDVERVLDVPTVGVERN